MHNHIIITDKYVEFGCKIYVAVTEEKNYECLVDILVGGGGGRKFSA
jgi:hypothetical protein